MKNYELVCIFDPQVGDQQFDQIVEKYQKYLEQNGAEIAHIDQWGLRRLAYTSVSLKGRQQGYYVLYQFGGEPEVIDPLERELKLDEEVLRHLVVDAGREFMRVPQLPSENELFSSSRGRDRDRDRDRDRGRGPADRSEERPRPPAAEGDAPAAAESENGGEEAASAAEENLQEEPAET